MYFDRFDIVAAHYFHAMHYHSGQWSDLYAKLCRISGYFKPSPMWNGPEDVSENCAEIYAALVERSS